MKILSLHIDGFGKFHNRDISFQDGLNVVYGKNEAGKSTLHTFIKGTFSRSIFRALSFWSEHSSSASLRRLR